MIEAMKQALEALEDATKHIFLGDKNGVEANIRAHKQCEALRQAIAEASQNGLYREGYRNGYGFGEAAGKRQAIAEAEKQEPVAWMHKETALLRKEINKPKGADWDADHWNPLYTTSQQRTWVGLTDEERNHARQNVTYSQLAMTVSEWADAVQIETEQRLMEKNK